jgi:hypothetical protein
VPLQEALQIVEGLDKEVKSIKSELMRICWYMRGGITIDEAYALAYDDREIIADLIKDNLETTKKTQLPFF